jgi:hypothetical protein
MRPIAPLANRAVATTALVVVDPQSKPISLIARLIAGYAPRVF